MITEEEDVSVVLEIFKYLGFFLLGCLILIIIIKVVAVAIEKAKEDLALMQEEEDDEEDEDDEDEETNKSKINKLQAEIDELKDKNSVLENKIKNMHTCPYCNSRVAKDSIKCDSCGARLNNE